MTVEPVVHADSLALAQIFGNLLASAVAYLAPDCPSEIVVTDERYADVTVFTVRDNGRGNAPSDISKVCESFRRVGRQDVPGDGMGLAYMRMLIGRHGGGVTSQSTLRVGITFTFTLPHTLPHEISHA